MATIRFDGRGKYGDDVEGGREPVVNRSRMIAACTACVLGVILGGCWGQRPLSVRLDRFVDPVQLRKLPRFDGSMIILADVEFWTDTQRISGIPAARRGNTLILGPGAAEMTRIMLASMFDEVILVRSLDRVEQPKRFDYVIRLVHQSFKANVLILPLVSRQRYVVEFSAEISLLDGTRLAEIEAKGKEGFWTTTSGDRSPFEGDTRDDRFRAAAQPALNAAVQESLFRLVDELADLPFLDGDRS
jgi:hypothetical protein